MNTYKNSPCYYAAIFIMWAGGTWIVVACILSLIAYFWCHPR